MEQLNSDFGTQALITDICRYSGPFRWNLSEDLPKFPDQKEYKLQEEQQNL